jgi:hypothetical protein
MSIITQPQVGMPFVAHSAPELPECLAEHQAYSAVSIVQLTVDMPSALWCSGLLPGTGGICILCIIIVRLKVAGLVPRIVLPGYCRVLADPRKRVARCSAR